MSKSIASRSVYVNRLRRAFILRCHPDRFRQHDDSIRKQQSALLQALGNRMIEEDFQDYASNTTGRKRNRFSIGNRQQQSVLNYVLEKRDGSLLYRTLDLNASAETILQNLVAALESSGAAKVPPPPPIQTQDNPHNVTSDESATATTTTTSSNMAWVRYNPNDDTKQQPIDHRYDVNSNRGRDLQRFLSTITRTQIEERKASRMDAIAAASVARTLFGFQSINGIRLGWSSEAFASLLSSLIGLHEEYNKEFRVSSFYPLRLIFSHDERKLLRPLDVYGGDLYLSPSATQLQWLESIRKVTEDRLEEFFENRRSITERSAILQEGLRRIHGTSTSSNDDIRVQRGFTCSSLEYYLFLERNGEHYRKIGAPSKIPVVSENDSNKWVPVLSSSSLSATGRRWRIVVESPMACRRPRVTKEGSILVPSTITNSELVLAVTNLSGLAGERSAAELTAKDKCRKAIEQLQYKLGLERVSRSNERVSRNDFWGALSRLHELQQRQQEANGDDGCCLSGASLRIAPGGQFCHLSDDGALVIPHNWI